MDSSNFELYHDYLKKSSLAGSLYRRLYLYPKLRCALKGRLVDVGCGLGGFGKYYGNTVFCDINTKNIDALKAEGLRAYLIAGDRLPFNDGEFDSALMDNVIEHIEDPTELLREVVRVMRKGGLLLVGVPGIKGYHGEEDHKVFYDLPKLNRVTEDRGLEYLSHFYTPFESAILDRHLKQYCLYASYIKS